jgi:hypothetical protein
MKGLYMSWYMAETLDVICLVTVPKHVPDRYAQMTPHRLKHTLGCSAHALQAILFFVNRNLVFR